MKTEKAEELFKKMGLVETSTNVQIDHGTYKFHDKIGNCNYIFRIFSNPRVEYYSDKTRSIQSYALFKSKNNWASDNKVANDMRDAIPYIVNRKVKGISRRAQLAMDIAQKIIGEIK